MSYQFEWHPAKAETNELESSAHEKRQGANAMTTKKHKTKTSPNPDRDSMRPEYDFSTAERGITAARYAEGTNVAFLDSLLRPLTQDQYDRWQRIEDEHAAKIYAAPERYNGDCPD